MKAKLLLLIFLVLFFTGCTSIPIYEDTPSSQEGLDVETQISSQNESNLELEIHNESTDDLPNEFQIPFGLEGADIVYIPAPGPPSEIESFTKIRGLEDQINYPSDVPVRQYPITEETILEVEKNYILTHLVDFLENRGFENPSDRDNELHVIYISHISTDYYNTLLNEAIKTLKVED